MRIVKHPHPALRHPSKPLRRVDGELRKIVESMFDLMYIHEGIGLAANQVDLPYRLFVINLTGDSRQKDQEQVFINPVITQRSGMAEAEEGCLSFPDLYAPVRRPDKITVTAYGLSGQELNLELAGLAARAVQHEADHLDGKVFIDRLTPAALLTIKQELADFEMEFEGDRRRGVVPDDREIAARLADLEALRT